MYEILNWIDQMSVTTTVGVVCISIAMILTFLAYEMEMF